MEKNHRNNKEKRGNRGKEPHYGDEKRNIGGGRTHNSRGVTRKRKKKATGSSPLKKSKNKKITQHNKKKNVEGSATPVLWGRNATMGLQAPKRRRMFRNKEDGQEVKRVHKIEVECKTILRSNNSRGIKVPRKRKKNNYFCRGARRLVIEVTGVKMLVTKFTTRSVTRPLKKRVCNNTSPRTDKKEKKNSKLIRDDRSEARR